MEFVPASFTDSHGLVICKLQYFMAVLFKSDFFD